MKRFYLVCLLLVNIMFLAGCSTGSFHFTNNDNNGKLDGFTFNGIYSVEENATDVQQISLCLPETHNSRYPGWTDTFNWLDSVNTNSSSTDNRGSISFFMGLDSACMPVPPEYQDEFMFFVKSPDLENISKWQGISSFKIHYMSNVAGIKVQLQAKVRKANGDEVFWKYKDSNGNHSFVDIPSTLSWTPIIFEMDDENVTLLFFSMKIIGDPKLINDGGDEGALYIDAVIPKK